MHADQSQFDTTTSKPAGDAVTDRRMQVRAYNYWYSLLDGRDFPSIEDLKPSELQSFALYSVLIDFSLGADDPSIPYIGNAIRQHCAIGEEVERLSDIPGDSLLAVLAQHYPRLIESRAPVGFESPDSEADQPIRYRGILMPFSSDGRAIDFVYCVLNWKTAEQQAAEEAAENPPVDESAYEDLDAPAALPDAAPEPVLDSFEDGPMAREAEVVVPVDPYAEDEEEQTEAVEEETAPVEDAVEVEETGEVHEEVEIVDETPTVDLPEEPDVEAVAAAEPEQEDVTSASSAAYGELASVDLPEFLTDEDEGEEVVESKPSGPFAKLTGTFSKMMGHNPLAGIEVDENGDAHDEAEDVTDTAEEFVAAPTEDEFVAEVPVEYEIVADEPVAEEEFNAEEPFVEEVAEEVSEPVVDEIVDQVEETPVVADEAPASSVPSFDGTVSFAAPDEVEEAKAEAEAEDRVIRELEAAAEAEIAAAQPETVEPVVEETEPVVEEAQAEEPLDLDNVVAEDVEAYEPEPAPVAEEQPEEPVEEHVADIPDIPVSIVAPVAPVASFATPEPTPEPFVEETPVETPVEEEVVAPTEPEAAFAPEPVAEDEEVTDEVVEFAPVEEEVAAEEQAETPEEAIEETPVEEEVVVAAADTDEQAEKEQPVEASALETFLAAARDAAAASKDADGRSRAALYKALGQAFDFSIVAAQDEAAYAALLEAADLTVQARAPMTPIVKLVFGADYDKTRLTEFAAALSYGHRNNVEQGEFEDFVADADGGLKGLVAAERALKRGEEVRSDRPSARLEKAHATLRRRDAIDLASLGANEEFALVVVRRDENGRHVPVARVLDDKLVERAVLKSAR
ncbi:hypothetical protein [Sphingomicrobium sediminis]|uniref:Uncharacterized protein n=1 Tax=Sphingomicrobium sediminis TaxID=2950949 RepID=A0A9X2J2H6_9SPHN|nr:hypothetical protein [Sphingomicrobium sediminis]MCM8557799.1 hypothetical protein [Sphingomicrobium sediminis]